MAKQYKTNPPPKNGNKQKQDMPVRPVLLEKNERAFHFINEPMDYTILFLVLFLVAFGLVMIYSTSSYKASVSMGDASYWLKRQGFVAVVGTVAMFIISKLDYHFWRYYKYQVIYYIFTVGLLLATMILMTATKGAHRWITIGPIQFQPSEVAKFTLILLLSYYISVNVQTLEHTKGILYAFATAGPIILLIGIENLSTSIILMVITIAMVYIASTRILPFFGIGAGIAVAAGSLLLARGYRVERVLIWLDPEGNEKGHQVMQGLYAIGSGGFFGKGLGQSMQKMGFIPESHNDMIFSVICEELGLFGAICVIALFFVLLWRFMIIAINAKDLYGSLIVIGVIVHLGVQVFVNIGVVSNTIPNTGIPLPFISYGGTSLLLLMCEMGLVLSVSRQIRMKE